MLSTLWYSSTITGAGTDYCLLVVIFRRTAQRCIQIILQCTSHHPVTLWLAKIILLLLIIALIIFNLNLLYNSYLYLSILYILYFLYLYFNILIYSLYYFYIHFIFYVKTKWFFSSFKCIFMINYIFLLSKILFSKYL